MDKTILWGVNWSEFKGRDAHCVQRFELHLHVVFFSKNTRAWGDFRQRSGYVYCGTRPLEILTYYNLENPNK